MVWLLLCMFSLSTHISQAHLYTSRRCPLVTGPNLSLFLYIRFNDQLNPYYNEIRVCV